ncbi:hypothetical protein DW839_01335 [Enterocloster bolteae]|uniref:Uncharacterized protein n=1 Tax=Enterocloster bolteae TaxID=208479 RepID=A0A414B1D0_9FIRM|nr:hypothetical protein DW839_01335 [Enterocloster bolteae]
MQHTAKTRCVSDGDVRRSDHSYLCSTEDNVNGPRSFLEGERAGMGPECVWEKEDVSQGFPYSKEGRLIYAGFYYN